MSKIQSSNASQSQTARSMGPLGGYARRGHRHRERAGHPGPDPGNDPAVVLSGPSTPSGRGAFARVAARRRACSGWGSSPPRTIVGWLPTLSIRRARFVLSTFSARQRSAMPTRTRQATPLPLDSEDLARSLSRGTVPRREDHRQRAGGRRRAADRPLRSAGRTARSRSSRSSPRPRSPARSSRFPSSRWKRVATIPPDKLGVPEQAILAARAMTVALRRVVRRQADRRHTPKRRSIGRQDRNADRSRPGHSRTGDGDHPGSQRHDALCRNRQRVDPMVAT